MSKWLVSQRDHQFAAKNMAELEKLASSGSIGRYDLIQPPGSSEWVYAEEIDSLQGNLTDSGDDDDFDFERRGKMGGIVTVVGLLAIAGGFGFTAYQNYQTTEAGRGLTILGDGISLTELIVTADNAAVYDRPDGQQVTASPRDTILGLLGKRNEWYHVQLPDGGQGYMNSSLVQPGYRLADEATQGIYDQLYNPDQYVEVSNSGWTRLDPSNPSSTTLGMLVTNNAKFDMTDMVVLVTLKDGDDNVKQVSELRVEGVIPAQDSAWVGQLVPADGDLEQARIMTDHMATELAEQDALEGWQYSETLTMVLEDMGTISGRIELIELRALPNPEVLP